MNLETVGGKILKRLRYCYSVLRGFRRFRTPTATRDAERELEILDQLALFNEALQDPYSGLRTLEKTKFAEDLKSKQMLTQCCELVEKLYWQLRDVLKAGPPKTRR